MKQTKGICLIRPKKGSLSFLQKDIGQFLSLLGVIKLGSLIYHESVLEIPVLFSNLNCALFAQSEVHNTQTEFGTMTILIESMVQQPRTREDMLLFGVYAKPADFKDMNHQNPFPQFFERIEADAFLLKAQNLIQQRIVNLRFLLENKELIKQIEHDKPIPKAKNDYITEETHQGLTQIKAFLGGVYLVESKKGEASTRMVYLMIRNINFNRIEISNVLYLIGSLTNVDEYLVDFSLSVCIVSFFDDNRLDGIISYLNNKKYFNQKLIVEKIGSAFPFKGIPYFEFEQLVFQKEKVKYHRYNKNLSIKFNPPSRTIHFTNLPDYFDSQKLIKILKDYHIPSQIQNLSDKSKVSKMFLVEFDKLFKSVEILSIFHNKIIGSKSIKVSFSRMNILESSK